MPPRKTLRRKFERCVHAIKRRGNYQAAIAICTKSVLFPAGKTIRRVKGRRGKKAHLTIRAREEI